MIMKKENIVKSDFILSELKKMFPDAKCELNHEDVFQLLIAVTLSAQTKDAYVNEVTPALFEAYPDAFSLSKADLKDVEKKIQSIGLYRNKAKNIIACSQSLIERFNGVVPQTRRELITLEGVGRKTANVVLSVGYNIPSMPVDTHVERISKRLGLAKANDSVEKVEEKLKRKFPRDRWNEAHHEMIFFGRYFCTARNPQCEQCPFTEICRKGKNGVK